ncbi:MAG: hypothetical protein R3F49_17165 [Planctomycetota bacterium]
MKIQCACGATLHDSARNRKFHMIGDVDLERWIDSIDAAIEDAAASARQRVAACMRIRSQAVELMRGVWQCPECGSLYVEGADRRLSHYRPTEG